MASGLISIRGARQHNLKNIDVDLHTGQITVVTGPSGSGKSSLVFDTLFAEGQRRYVETFSAYARQFLDRMDRPAVDRVEGVPAAIAIDQSNPVRNSRSTVGTMTELNDHLKLLFARAARLFDRETARQVLHDSSDTIYADLCRRSQELPPSKTVRWIFTFAVELPAGTTAEEVSQWLLASGFTRVHQEREISTAHGPRKLLDVMADRFKVSFEQGLAERGRTMEAIESALKRGGGRMQVHELDDSNTETAQWSYSAGWHCPQSDLTYTPPQSGLFSFNSPMGACEECKGFGRVIGIDFDLVIPNPRKTLREGAIQAIQTPAWKETQEDLLKYAGLAGVPVDTPWSQLTAAQQAFVLDGSPQWSGQWNRQWYGIKRFFGYLESKTYKMHIRVLLSKYRSYTACPACGGSRLKIEGLLWRLGSQQDADQALPPTRRFMPPGVSWSAKQLQDLPGLCLHDLMLMPIHKMQHFFSSVDVPNESRNEATEMLLKEIRVRLRYLCEVGLGYLTLDRQARTLSGGEVQRINLTTALGTSLVNTLFVLDEPSIGLHPRDMRRIVQAMQRLRDAGNTLVVVEHDPAVMWAADRLIDMGPGAGEHGGHIVYDGSMQQALHADTLTSAYLTGRKKISSGRVRTVLPQAPKLILTGVQEHNLRNVAVELPLGHLVCVTGVSGSGKSTLIQDVLYPAVARYLGQTAPTPGCHETLLGAERLSEVVMVDQSPLGKTTRSNPASVVGAFDEIRKQLAKTPLAIERGYTAGMFSFNSGEGRCPTCGGSGFEHVEMQFLSDVYLRCPECNGERYRPQILQVELERQGQFASVAQILNLTVTQALDFFQYDLEICGLLQPLLDVGLGYVKLGQPVPTLSGGEAQRLKLAAQLSQSTAQTRSRQALSRKGKLFLFDEPTTGLHFEDIAQLMRAFAKLLEAGHSLVVIEHNLDVIRNADWIIDLGPEGGEEGGQIVCVGSPEDILQHSTSHTAAALREYSLQMQVTPSMQVSEKGAEYQVARKEPGSAVIEIVNANEHNLQGLNVRIPRGQFTVVTGVSGSGKSTLAFDILFNEGQRRYLESLNAYARSIVQPAGRPDVDAVYGIPPTVAIEQRLSRGGQKSTVATVTEIWHYLRLLYVRLGTQHCVHDGAEVKAQSLSSIVAQLLTQYEGQHVGILTPLVVNRKGLYTDLAQWAKKKGHTHLRVDGHFTSVAPWPRLDRFKEHTLELPIGDLTVDPAQEATLRDLLEQAVQIGKGVIHVLAPLDGLAQAMSEGADTGSIGRVKVFSTKRACPVCGTSYAEPDPRLFSFNSSHGWCCGCMGTGLRLTSLQRDQFDDHLFNRDDRGQREKTLAVEEPNIDDLSQEPCSECQGHRLNPTALSVRWQDQPISVWARYSVNQAHQQVQGLMLQGREALIAKDVLTEMEARLEFLQQVGLGYLTLERAAPTLSGGEAQRIRLAAQLGSHLQGVCYVLDEPTIGLHPRDNQMLLQAMQRLSQQGNTLVVVEHDEETIRHADHIIDMGPGAGRRGGRLVAQGTLADILAEPASLTGRSLARPLQQRLQPRHEVNPQTPSFHIVGAHLNNLRRLDVTLPLNRLVVVTGVSGSGKSTLARDVLMQNLLFINQRGKTPHWQSCTRIEGWEQVQRVLEVDQTPIGKTPRSCPATYVGFWDAVRQLFADSLESRARGYTPARFSFNTGQGRCSACEGQGVRTIEMSFLPDVKVLCHVCQGQRFNTETLAVTWKGKNIGDILKMEVDEAVEFFASMPRIVQPLQWLKDVGLGYLTLGQPSPTLSGGEAQRIKLVTELAKAKDISEVGRKVGMKAPHTLYVLDEPTVGLHMADVARLIQVLHRLVNAGHSVIVIEHDLDVMAEADWIVDMGPEGGDQGGQVVVQGTPDQICDEPRSHTGMALKGMWRHREQQQEKEISF
jgi:excinuclease ABC subunit A